jgi:single-stranded DNA-binding protein
MSGKTENKVLLKGFVGDYIRLPTYQGDPARFDIMTSTRLNTTEGEIISTHDWHTIVTSDVDFVERYVVTGALIKVRGRLSSRKAASGRQTEIIARELELVEEPKRRRRS